VPWHDSIVLLPMPRRLQRRTGTSAAAPQVVVDPAIAKPQGYRLSISSDRVQIIGHDAHGVFYGRQTLAQLRRQFGDTLPCVEIEDWPDFAVRGLLLDISRDKVPTMHTLLGIVDWLAELKVNQLQLYTEHTFAYRGHEGVWRDADPMTGEQIRQLDAYCQTRFIDLVPNQNSLGHMHRWLRHARYLPLAEAPEGSDRPDGSRCAGPFSLCPTDPRSLDLLADLYSQLLPNFSSKLFNVGCDETFDIGQGRSRDQCQARGVATVYLDFLKKVRELASAHARQMMFWADVILHHAKQITQIPPGAIALNWGYEADHPFDAEAGLLRQSGVPFYVCPGTSSWCSIAGRTDNMLANQRIAAKAGLKHGALGHLNTDWGDFGHLQYWPMSFAGIAAGAAMSWCLQANRDLPLAQALDVQVFCDQAAVSGKLACELGNVYRAVGRAAPNRSVLFDILVPSAARNDPMQGITREGLDAAEAAIDNAIKPLRQSQMQRADAELIRGEFANAAAMLKHACRKGRWKLGAKDSTGDMAAELERIIRVHRDCWLARNRPGGLEQSAARLADNLAEYR